MLLIFVVLGVLISVGIGKINSADDQQIVTEEMVRNYYISPASSSNMDNAYLYRQLYEQQLIYNQNTIYMKMNANEVYIGDLQYYISAGKDTDLIGLEMRNILDDSFVMEELQKIWGDKIEAAYIRELLGSWIGDANNVRTSISLAEIPNSEETAYKGEVVGFLIYGLDEENCDQMMQVLRNKIEELSRQYAVEYDSYLCENVVDRVRFTIDTSIAEKQKVNVTNLNNYIVSMNNFEGMLSEQEKAYYKLVYLNEPYTAVPSANSSFKLEMNIVLGGLTALLCWIIVGFVQYLLDGHIKYAEELQRYYGLQVIGRYELDSGSAHGIEKWKKKVVCKKTGSYNNSSYLGAALKLLGDELYLSANLDPRNQELLSALKIENTKLLCGGLLHQDNDSLIKAKEIGNVVFVVNIGRMTYAEMRQELDICKLQNIHVLGTIVLE